jgi:hypothetical protein
MQLVPIQPGDEVNHCALLPFHAINCVMPRAILQRALYRVSASKTLQRCMVHQHACIGQLMLDLCLVFAHVMHHNRSRWAEASQ